MAGMRRLKTSQDIRRYLANLINRAESGETEIMTASKLGYLASILAKVIETSDLEERIKRLEEMKPGRLQAVGGGR